MRLIMRKSGKVHLYFESYESAMLERYVSLLQNSDVKTVEELLSALIGQQLDFIVDSLTDEDKLLFEVAPLSVRLKFKVKFWVDQLFNLLR